jgi:DNA polymerase-1
VAPLKALLEDPSVKKAAQNAKDATLVLRVAGVDVQGLEFDTMVASYVLDPGRRSHLLDLLALEFLDHKLTSLEELCGKGKTFIPFDQVPIECARDYACEDADIIWQLRERFEPALDDLQLARLFHDVEMPLVQVLAEMEWTGITIDVDWFASLKVRFERERKARRARDLRRRRPGIQHQLEPAASRNTIRQVESTSAQEDEHRCVDRRERPQQLAEEGHQLPVLLMEYRELSKLESTYIDALPAYVHPKTGRLHTSFSQTVAATGRLSSSDPNLQNIPIRRELGRDIRRGFIPRKGWTAPRR